jgi:hypothetical protein
LKPFVVSLLVLAIWWAAVFTGQACLAGKQPGIYYVDRHGNLVIEYCFLANERDLYFALAQAVVQPPSSLDLHTAAPPGTRLYGAWLDQGILYVDYSKELFSYGGGTFREQRLLAQITYTLTQFAEVRYVQVLVEGRKVLAPEGSPTDAPLKRGDFLQLFKEGKGWPEKE